MAIGNPNFPDFLNIYPSFPPGKGVGSSTGNSGHAHGSTFDSGSQESAIKLYGIAGRVW